MSEQTKTTEEIMDEMERSYFKTDIFEAIGKGDDYKFQILAFMGDATHGLIVANTIATSSDNDIPQELKDELKRLASECSELKDKIRNHEG